MKILGLLNLDTEKQRGFINFVYSTVMNNIKDDSGNHCFQTHLNSDCQIVARLDDDSAGIIDVFGEFGESEVAHQYIYPYISHYSILEPVELVYNIFFQQRSYTVRELYGKAPKGRSLASDVDHTEFLNVMLERLERVDVDAAKNAFDALNTKSEFVVVGDLRANDADWIVSNGGTVLDFSQFDLDKPVYQWHNEVYTQLFSDGFFDQS